MRRMERAEADKGSRRSACLDGFIVAEVVEGENSVWI